tara:strand:+ start:370 stop:585 length:216 start_codon:yes stop_codon:yes gene_type:complete
MNHNFKHPSYYDKLRKENKDFLEEVEKDEKILKIGLEQSRKNKKERQEKEKSLSEMLQEGFDEEQKMLEED